MDDALQHNPRIRRGALAEEHAALFAWALSRCGRERARAEEVLQMSYVAIIEGRARFDGRSTLRTFLFGVVHNVARSFHRNEQRTAWRWLRRDADDTEQAPPAVDEAVDATETETLTRDLRRGLHRLPARQREVLELMAWRDFTLEQTAEILGISVGSARTHYHRAKTTLRERLGAIAGTPP